MMLRLRHDIGNDIPPLRLVVFPLLYFGPRSVGLLGGDLSRLPMVLCLVSFQFSHLLIHEVYEGKQARNAKRRA